MTVNRTGEASLLGFMRTSSVEQNFHAVSADFAAGASRVTALGGKDVAAHEDLISILRYPSLVGASVYGRKIFAILDQIRLLQIGAAVVAVMNQPRGREGVTPPTILVHDRGVEILDGVVGVVTSLAVEYLLRHAHRARQPPGTGGEQQQGGRDGEPFGVEDHPVARPPWSERYFCISAW